MGAAVAVVVAVLMGGVRLWLPHWRPDLRPGEQYAVDVSAFQGAVDWDAVRRDGIGLAYLKATEGRDFTDARFRANVEGASRAGMGIGAYHFFTLCSPGAEQAEHFRRVTGTPAALPPAVDLELAGNCAARPDRAAVERELAAFLTTVEAWSHRPTVLYVGRDWLERYGLPPCGRPVWVRRLLLRPNGALGTGGEAIWQASASASVDGIRGRADLDVVRPARLSGQVPQKVR